MNRTVIGAMIVSAISAIIMMVFQDPSILDQAMGIVDTILGLASSIFPFLEFVFRYTSPVIIPLGEFMTTFSADVLSLFPADSPVPYLVISIVIMVFGAILNFVKPEKIETFPWNAR